MVLEVVTDGSASKDRKTLRLAYWQADIDEFWLVDARKPTVKFDILRNTRHGYVRIPKADGWVASTVFGHSFRLTRDPDADPPDLTLEVR